MTEVERRFLVDHLPAGCGDGDPIVQGYLSIEPVAVRVRRRVDTHTLTIKIGTGLERVEVERPIDADEFQQLWRHATALRIEKRRHLVPLGADLVAELDIFGGALAGHRLVEVEFSTTAAASSFTPPDWFGAEVTDDVRFTNASLARDGWPS